MQGSKYATLAPPERVLDLFLINEMPDRPNGSQPLLPLVTKEKDNRSKEETHKLLNGSVDTHDRVTSHT
ncbi:Phosphatidylinositol:ceramide inositolphosphotransferase 1 [Platanthera guangdongensis]|uniref:Phosphatidylinositol:ceramide inositolphosphotransferase 1 n=1 Tax=Platanthera guangdongensis TaxID=2320717 RepID=A0ABR2LW51_9ASPA